MSVHRTSYNRDDKVVEGSCAEDVFCGPASFERATFQRDASFADATFKEFVSFSRARFEVPIRFDRATFERGASFAGATFCDGAFLPGARFGDDADFSEAVLDGRAFGRTGFSVIGSLKLQSARFARRVNLVASADALECSGLILDNGGIWELRWAEIDLRRLVAQDLLVIRYDRRSGFAEDLLEGLCRGGGTAEARGMAAEELVRRRSRGPAPRLLSVAAANVGNVVLSGVDLRACRFRGAYNLDKLSVYEDSEFGTTPGWTGRRSIAEEHRWRTTRWPTALNRRWYQDEHRRPAHLEVEEDVPTPSLVAALYRGLRKGLEDHKDEPGAADFYYGEMEMRRYTGPSGGFGRRLASWWERVTILLYWALSGYALRPFRAFVALLVLIFVAAGAFHQYGFVSVVHPLDPPASGSAEAPPPERLPRDLGELGEALTDDDALVYSVSSAAALAPLPEARLTATGRAIRTVERVLGPIFVGLVLLSIRGRVKR
jgi:hypothetical protein